LQKKFIFSQISGALVGCSTSYIALKILLYFFSDWYQHDNAMHVAVFAAFIIASCFFGMYIWGKILVLMKVLSKKEAQGYPFSKPWNSQNSHKSK